MGLKEIWALSSACDMKSEGTIPERSLTELLKTEKVVAQLGVDGGFKWVQVRNAILDVKCNPVNQVNLTN